MLLYIWLEEKWGNEALGSITRFALQNKGRWVAGWYSHGSSLTNYPFIYIGFSCVQMTIDHCRPCTTHSPCRPIMGQHHGNHINSIQFLLAHPRLFKLIAGWQHPMLGWIIGVPMGPTGQFWYPSILDIFGSLREICGLEFPTASAAVAPNDAPHLMATTSMAVMYYSWNAGTSNVVKTHKGKWHLWYWSGKHFWERNAQANQSGHIKRHIKTIVFTWCIFWGSWWYMLVNC